MLIIVGLILSIGASLWTYFGTNLSNLSPWYLFLLIPFVITYFVVYLNIYWLIVLISVLPYKNKDFTGKVNMWCLFHIRLTASFCLTLRGILVHKKGFNKMPRGASLIIFNHISDYDPWILYKVMGGRYAFVGKYALRNIPMVRSLASSIGTLYVDDNNLELNRKMIENAIDYISNKETSVAIAPEGTRNTTGRLMPFKHGGFNIATRSKCNIVLVGFSGMEKTLTKSKFSLVRVKVELFDVIKPEEYDDKSAGQVAVMCEERYKRYLGE